MSDCLFCKIISGEIPSTKVYEDETVYAFRDINPVAPTHILVVPKTHIDMLEKTSESDSDLLGKALTACAKIAKQEKLSNGYRVVINDGEEGQQSVSHIHLHLIGGKMLKWPPC